MKYGEDNTDSLTGERRYALTTMSLPTYYHSQKNKYHVVNLFSFQYKLHHRLTDLEYYIWRNIYTWQQTLYIVTKRTAKSCPSTYIDINVINESHIVQTCRTVIYIHSYDCRDSQRRLVEVAFMYNNQYRNERKEKIKNIMLKT